MKAVGPHHKSIAMYSYEELADSLCTYTAIEPNHNLIHGRRVLRRKEPEEQLLLRGTVGRPSCVRSNT